jgi:translation initiation factor 3 subunit D
LPEFKSETNIGSCLTVTDPIIQKLAQNKEADIFATDVALSALMCAAKAQYAWDIMIKKYGPFIFIDKRDTENILDWQTISETAQPDFQATDDDSMNGTKALMAEATRICKSW